MASWAALAPGASAGDTTKTSGTASWDAKLAVGSTYLVKNLDSEKCVTPGSSGTADGNPVRQHACVGTDAQRWTFTATTDGYFRIGAKSAPDQVWEVTGASTENQALIELGTYNDGESQQWYPVAESGGSYHFLSRATGKCLGVPNGVTVDTVQLHQYDCAGVVAPSFTLSSTAGTISDGNSPDESAPGETGSTGGNTPAPEPTAGNEQGNGPSTGDDPDLGENVLVFDPSMSSDSIQAKLDSVYGEQEENQFGDGRYALLFRPGSYDVDVKVGYYTQVLGLGRSPEDTTISGGGVNADARWFDGNATQNFWRSVENLTDKPSGGTVKWAVSQASPMRRVHIAGSMVLDDGGWSSGGFLADSKVDGQVNSGSQQQWLSRNDEWEGWEGSNWNMVFVGTPQAPAESFPDPPNTNIGKTPVIAEKPYLYVDSAGTYQVFVPAVRENTSGTTWSGDDTAGKSLPISQFYVAKPDDSVATLNSALSSGKNLLFTPGVYHLNDTLKVTRPGTVVLGLGLATLQADDGVTAMSVADVDGVRIGGILFEAGAENSPVLLQVGPRGAKADHSDNPTVLSDVFARIGGAGVGKAEVSVSINSNDVIGDDLWLWRADHGDGVGWDSNTAATGLVVNGADVTMYGLAAEHYQEYSVLWNGNGGRTYFLQNELPYDPPGQDSWMNGETRGYAAYKVANSVTSHQGWGLGVYCNFDVDPSVTADHGFEVPSGAGVKLHNLVTVSLGGQGTISHIVNSEGGSADAGNNVAYLTSYE
jgi:hypothetical protein